MALRRRGGSIATVRLARDRRVLAAAFPAYVALGIAVRNGAGVDQRLFGLANHGSDSQPALRVPQQLGTPWLPPALALTAFVARRPHLAVAAAFALPVEKLAEVPTKKLLARRRPAQVDGKAELHDDAPADGPSYPSGHAAMVTLTAVLTGPYLPPAAWAAGAAAVGAAAFARVQQGAHFPLDVVGGALLGTCVASAMRIVFGRPA